ncbi:MAG: hypothetical protein IKS54_09410 [Erysipelotrichaceae bacterium]|nr:hypothetical protein [Erysipelotrichaceae bacterium]
MPKDKRFEIIETQNGFLTEIKVIIDKETGVNYMFVHDGYAGGLSVMVDENGDPLVSEIDYDE